MLATGLFFATFVPAGNSNIVGSGYQVLHGFPDCKDFMKHK
jgi:hypothetical protein